MKNQVKQKYLLGLKLLKLFSDTRLIGFIFIDLSLKVKNDFA